MYNAVSCIYLHHDIHETELVRGFFQEFSDGIPPERNPVKVLFFDRHFSGLGICAHKNFPTTVEWSVFTPRMDLAMSSLRVDFICGLAQGMHVVGHLP